MPLSIYYQLLISIFYIVIIPMYVVAGVIVGSLLPAKIATGMVIDEPHPCFIMKIDATEVRPWLDGDKAVCGR
jgi:hypothetical protein